VEKGSRALRTIRTNLELTGLGERAKIVRADVFQYLLIPPQEDFDYIYVAPPQYRGLWKRTLQVLDARPDWLAEDGWVIVQIHPLGIRGNSPVGSHFGNRFPTQRGFGRGYKVRIFLLAWRKTHSFFQGLGEKGCQGKSGVVEAFNNPGFPVGGLREGSNGGLSEPSLGGIGGKVLFFQARPEEGPGLGGPKG